MTGDRDVARSRDAIHMTGKPSVVNNRDGLVREVTLARVRRVHVRSSPIPTFCSHHLGAVYLLALVMQQGEVGQMTSCPAPILRQVGEWRAAVRCGPQSMRDASFRANASSNSCVTAPW